MLDSFLTDEKRDLKRQRCGFTNAKNIMVRTCEQQGSFNENKAYKKTYIYNQNETDVIYRAHNEERRPREFNTYSICGRQKKQEETASNLLN